MREVSSIDREALVRRHNPRHGTLKASLDAPLSLGNGRFCFTADCTGLQTFPGGAFPRLTMAEWFWHSYPDAPASDKDLRLTPYDTGGRAVGYATDEAGQEALFKGLRQNPHKGNLGRLGFDFGRSGFVLEEHSLSLGAGILLSAWRLNGDVCTVATVVHPEEDIVSVRVQGLDGPPPAVILSFPYPSHRKEAGDFTMPERHRTALERGGKAAFFVTRVIDDTRLFAQIALNEGASCALADNHTLKFSPAEGRLDLSLRFTPEKREDAPAPFEEVRKAARNFWNGYWNTGAALDFGAAQNNRQAMELERRLVLSQYLTAIQSRGRLPPAETGLSCNSWYGKFHLEMHPLHAAHFALWGRAGELERSLPFYTGALPEARRIAASQGYRGARWPKMCGPEGRNSPSSIAVLLLWQQPHPVFLCSLVLGSKKTEAERRAFLSKYRDVVAESASFMASFLHYDSDSHHSDDNPPARLGPPCIPVQERFDPASVGDPAFEVEYWRWGLRAACKWLALLGEEAPPEWERAAGALPPPAVREGLYLAHRGCPETFDEAAFRTDHPSMLMLSLFDKALWRAGSPASGPGETGGGGFEAGPLGKTLDKVLETWDMNSLWGWDFPALALCALALGLREQAQGWREPILDLLLMNNPKNTYLASGHNKQTGDEALPCYLPGNGALLFAAALMARAGAFPPEWGVRQEGFGGEVFPGEATP